MLAIGFHACRLFKCTHREIVGFSQSSPPTQIDSWEQRLPPYYPTYFSSMQEALVGSTFRVGGAGGRDYSPRYRPPTLQGYSGR